MQRSAYQRSSSFRSQAKKALIGLIGALLLPTLFISLTPGLSNAALVWYAAMDENTGTTVTPSVGSGTCTFQITPTWVTGKFGSAVNFNSADSDYLACSVTPVSSNDWTVGVWIKLGTSASYRYIVHVGDSEGANIGGIELYISNADKLGVCATVGTNSRTCAESTATINETGSVWTHVTARKSGTALTAWINGVQDGGGTLSSSTMDYSATGPQFYIGIRSSDQSNPFEGAIDDLRIYDSVEDPAVIFAIGSRRPFMPIFFP